MSERDPGAGGRPAAGRRAREQARRELAPHPFRSGRYRRQLGVLAVVLVALAVIFAIARNPGAVSGIAPGARLLPFAVPLATGTLTGDANVAAHAHEGSAGDVPACSVRKAGVLNICALYERGPVVLALFVDSGPCPRVLSRMQAIVASFPGVQFAAVAIEGNPSEFDSVRTRLRALVRARSLSFPVGIDRDGVLAALYKVVSCPQVSFAYPGGIVQSKALLVEPSTAKLRARVTALVRAAQARGWREPAR